MSCRAAIVPFSLAATLLAQGPPPNGPRPVDAGWYALTGGTVVQAPGKKLANTTVVVRNGEIVAVGGETPAGATAIDCTGLVIYAGLIEPFLPIDVPSLDPAVADVHWNPMVQPQRSALDGTGIGADERKELRALGFTAAAIAPSGGILKGTSSVVLLDEPTETERARVVREHAAEVCSLQTRGDGYPGSEMGAIAVLRQTLHDGLWLERCRAAVFADPSLAARAPQPSAALLALAAHKKLPLWFDVQDELQALRVCKVAAEFERTAVVVGSGMEFRRLAAIAAQKCAVIVPVAYPEAPDVGTVAAAGRVSLRHLQSWEQAPTNAKRLLDAGVAIAFTSARLREKKDFRQRLHEAMQCGVTADQALAALTTVPSKLLGVESRLGTVEPGKLANLVVAAGDLFEPKTVIRDVWVGGRRHTVTPKDQGLDGTWQLTDWTGTAPSLAIDGAKVTFRIGEQEKKVAGVERLGGSIAFRVADAIAERPGTCWLRLHRAGDGITGSGTQPDGTVFAFRGTRAEAAPPVAVKPEKPEPPPFTPPSLDALPTPLGGYGFATPPAPATFAIVGVTVWTSDERGVVKDGAVIVRDGKIVYAGPRDGMPELPAGATTIEGNGRHVTPGLIDCHSHTGISRGINEGGQAVTAEVRVQDVIDPDDVNWYRQLAGGVTACNQLHGSANAIGGQSSTVKVRFGALHPDDMRLQGAPDGIKFALGENPRRANGSGPNPRYPNTRMGVEALLRDRFAAAAVWRAEHAAYTALNPQQRAKVIPPRLDLELEALAEVLAGARRIHCHSYRQDEIFMLCGLAKEYGVKIGTFQHVLEGYKVADAIGQHAVGASSFSDWWAYKFEVYDAIPDNGAILHEAGVSVSFNSDSNEHARRLNTEAGKAVKYGNVAPADALCFVTKNPAVQLGIFERTGSLTAGKDADLVLWSGDPLSYASRCEMTWVEGRPLFSRGNDVMVCAAIAKERQRLLQKAVAAARRPGARDGDPKDAYWRAEDLTLDYCCRNHEGGR